ncbi:MAG TPA: hypothetical protein DCG34_02420 [Clostridiales bacterium]|nr:hypothetical protein [Clostridiales bacterium]
MKKLVAVILMAMMIITLIGCQNQTEVSEDTTANIDMTLEEIIDEMYAKSEMEWPKLVKTAVNEENMAYMLGVTNFEFEEALASEPMMSAQAHSVVLVKVDNTDNLETIKKDIKENVDGRKWICVGVEDDNIIVDSAHNYIVLIMDNEGSEALQDAFHQIMGI